MKYFALTGVAGYIAPRHLQAIRETGNRHDPLAIRVEWRGQKLGYVPRAQNAAISRAMDRGLPLIARVSSISDNKNPWERIAFEVFAEL